MKSIPGYDPDARFKELEGIIEKGKQTFLDVGFALAEIRETKLYLKTHKSFEAYCKARWGISVRRSNQLVQAAEAVKSIGTTNKAGTTVPVNERQARELAKAPEEDRASIMERAAELAKAEGKEITARHIALATNPLSDPDLDHKYTRPIKVGGEPGPELDALLRQHRKDSAPMRRLKDGWRCANKRDRKAFLEWIKTQ